MRQSFTLDTGTTWGQRLTRGGAVIFLFAIGIVSANSVSCVQTGHVGVVTVFGRVTGRVMPEGIHVVNPLSRVHELARSQNTKVVVVGNPKTGLPLIYSADK
jgi:regulator of protease activity HflC (stomatin/prohibitin superfamily)